MGPGALGGSGCLGPERIWPGRFAPVGIGLAGAGIGLPGALGTADAGGAPGIEGLAGAGAAGADGAGWAGLGADALGVGAGAVGVGAVGVGAVGVGTVGCTATGSAATGATGGGGITAGADTTGATGATGGATGRFAIGGCIGVPRPINGGRRGNARGRCSSSSLATSFAGWSALAISSLDCASGGAMGVRATGCVGSIGGRLASGGKIGRTGEASGGAIGLGFSSSLMTGACATGGAGASARLLPPPSP